ncbi:GNAT family N-acetyltransferase [Paenibacillus sp. UNC451MF]|uniref:GNAT family N-acetyltransferase n=1 Tax=Paenibacillus sp. UNC451MF TaxID=1449063 RepID=UPI00048D41C5|nr:GNAT family N-acetyltransferase [Paenibacillus sp. UNC451MF]
MEIYVKEFAHGDRLDPIDDSFTVDSMLVLTFTGHKFHYVIKEIPPYTKSYMDIEGKDDEETDYSSYINNPDQVMYLAFCEEQLAGQIMIKRNWNQYAYIEDIKVDLQFRRYGIGRQLIDKAKSWAKSGNMKGIMLETQNNNVKACKFYESCGFVLGGIDCYIYKNILEGREETALYWYLST